MNMSPEQLEAFMLLAPYLRIPALIAGFAALRRIAILAGVIGGKESPDYEEAQNVAAKVFGTGYVPSSVVGSNKGGPPSGE